jgi:TackOD1 domain-containing protein
MSSADKNKTNEILKALKKHGHNRYVPLFKPEIGFCYDKLEAFNFKEQVQFFGALEKARAAIPSEALFTIIKCNSCGFPYFCIKYICTFCRSSNIARGTAIQHDTCGNVDFDREYMALDGKLVCDKCQKELKALGVDYSKIDHYYKCLDCKVTLPNFEYHYGCLHCGRFLTQDEPQTLQLFSYTIDSQKLSSIFDKNDYVSSIKRKLENIGIGSSVSDKLTGVSMVQHTFDLIVYNKHNIPQIVLDILGPSTAGHNQEDDEIFLLSFISRCMEVKVPNKVLISFMQVNDRVKQLANTYQIHVIDAGCPDDNLQGVINKISKFVT